MKKSSIPTQEDQYARELLSSPLAFAKRFLRNPSEPSKPWRPRWMQEILLQPHENRLHTVRGQRTCGKTQTLVAIILWFAYTKPYKRVLIIGPYRLTIQRVFDELNKQIDLSPELTGAITRRRQNPFEIVLDNGTIVRGIAAGVNTNRAGHQVHGEHPNFIYIDEADYLEEKTWEHFMPLVTPTEPDVEPPLVWATTTPTGLRSFFYDLCEKKDPTERGHFWVDWWFPARHLPNITFKGTHTQDKDGFYHPGKDAEILCTKVNPSWTAAQDREQLAGLQQQGYYHEIMAWWGDATSTVFPRKLIDAAMSSGQRQHLTYINDLSGGKGGMYTIGVDVDKRQATPHLCVVEYIPKSQEQCAGGSYIVRLTKSIERNDYVYHTTRQEIRTLLRQFQPRQVYIDKQPGDVMTEELNHAGFAQVVSKQFKESVEMYNTASGEVDRKPLKHVMINIAQRLLEEGRITMCPISLETAYEDEKGVTRTHKEAVWDDNFIKQIRNYQVVNVTKTGVPEYTAEDEHAVDAFLLAIWAAFENFDNPYELSLTQAFAVTQDLTSVLDVPPPQANTPYIPPEERFVPMDENGYRSFMDVRHPEQRLRRMSEPDARGFSGFSRRTF